MSPGSKRFVEYARSVGYEARLAKRGELGWRGAGRQMWRLSRGASLPTFVGRRGEAEAWLAGRRG